MPKITVQGVQVDPYFMIGVTPDDDAEQMRKAFKRRAKKYHPDKVPMCDREDATIKFNIICECFEYIMKRRADHWDHKRPRRSLEKCKYENCHQMTSTQEDTTKRYKNQEEYKKFDAGEFCSNQFTGKRFSIDRFNKIFEWNAQKHVSKETKEKGLSSVRPLLQDTSYALVHSYNGLMINGDEQQCDFKQQFGKIENPTKAVKIPKDLESKSPPKRAFNSYVRERDFQITVENVKKAGDSLFQRTLQELAIKEEIDKQRIVNSGVYVDQIVQQALKGELDASPTLLKAMRSDRIKKKINY